MKKLLLVLSLMALCGATFAATVTESGDGYAAKGKLYEAAVDGKGIMTSFKVGGVDFFTSYLGNPDNADEQQFGESVTREGNTLLVKNSAFTATYTFADDSVKIDVPVGGPLFCMVFDKEDFTRWPDMGWHRRTANGCFDHYAVFPCEKYNLLVQNGRMTGANVGYGNIGIVLTPRVNSAAEAEKYNDMMGVVSDKLAVTSPVDYRVFQRATKYDGKVAFSGKTAGDAVKVKVSGKSLKGNFDTGFVNATLKNGEFSIEVPVTAGGWYKAEVKALKGGKVIAEKTVNHVGVGEVFIGAGQSNSTNCGQFQIPAESGMIVSFDGNTWQPGSGPFLGTHDYTQSGCYYPSFGDALSKMYGVPVAVASTGHGGSSIEQWQPDVVAGPGYPSPEQGSMYSFMMKRMQQLGKGGFRAVLWHQGESNATSPVDEEYNNMVTLIQASKKDAGWDVPWIVAKVSYHNPEHPSWPNIREVHSRLWANGIAEKGPDTDTLTGDMRDYEGKGIHFSPKGLKAHGEMWARCVSRYLDKVL